MLINVLIHFFDTWFNRKKKSKRKQKDLFFLKKFKNSSILKKLAQNDKVFSMCRYTITHVSILLKLWVVTGDDMSRKYSFRLIRSDFLFILIIFTLNWSLELTKIFKILKIKLNSSFEWGSSWWMDEFLEVLQLRWNK